jgi:hypothetical protein
MSHAEAVKYERLLGRITNSVQLEKFVRAIETTETQLREELDNFIEARTHVQESKKLELARTELSTTLNNSSNLVDLLSNAGSLASTITARVRLLDSERSRVNETVEYVSQVKELKSSILAANSALEQQNWEGAAKAIGKIRSLPTSGDFINAVVPSTDVPDFPDVVVNKWIEQLTELFSSEFTKAADSRDVEQLTNFFSLFPLIGKDNTGLDCYSKFICNIIASQSRLIITNQSQQDIIGFYPAALMKLLEIVSTMLNQHSHVIAKYYGLSHMTGIIERVERETDSQAGLISDTFYDQRNFSRVIDEIQAYKFPFLMNSLNRNTPSPRGSGEYKRMSEEGISVVMTGDLSTELSSFLHCWSLYCKFIAVKWNEYQGIKQEELKLPTPILESKFSKKIQSKFLPTFEVLSTFYIRGSLEQAFQIEEFPDLDIYIKNLKVASPETPPVSSSMEDIIMVISTSLKQAIETGQPITVKNIINNTRKILDKDYISTLSKRLKDLQPRSGSVLTISTIQQQAQQPVKQQNTMGSIFMRGANALNQIANADDRRLHTFIIHMNTVSLGSVYFEKIIQQNIALLTKNYPFGTDSSKLEIIVNGLNEHFQNRSTDILNEQVQILFNQALKNKLKILLTDCFKDVDYLISSYDEEENVVTRRFIQNWNALISPYIKTLDRHVFDRLISTLVSTLSNLLERKVWSLEKSINELGSIKLERDFSGLIGEVTHNRYSLRDKFLRVTQIIMILGFDDEEDEVDMNWVLTPSERQRARALRVDRK